MERWCSAGGIHHHLPLLRDRAAHPGHSHERGAGCYGRRHRQLRPSVPFCVDHPRAGCHRDVLPHPIGGRAVEFAVAPQGPRANCRITPVADLPGSARQTGDESRRTAARTGSRGFADVDEPLHAVRAEHFDERIEGSRAATDGREADRCRAVTGSAEAMGASGSRRQVMGQSGRPAMPRHTQAPSRSITRLAYAPLSNRRASRTRPRSSPAIS